eukprot:3149069-Pyramimonas_sp.AAC.1
MYMVLLNIARPITDGPGSKGDASSIAPYTRTRGSLPLPRDARSSTSAPTSIVSEIITTSTSSDPTSARTSLRRRAALGSRHCLARRGRHARADR